MSSRFCSLFKKGVKQEREKGIGVSQMMAMLGYKSKTAIHGMARGDFLPNKEAYAKMCELWPFMTGALDPKKLVGRVERKSAAPHVYKNKKHNTNNAPRSCMSDFEFGCWLGTFPKKPEAAQWIEMLETATRNGLALQVVVTALKSGLVSHG